jgi:8-oxo-dGTP diphosphatase
MIKTTLRETTGVLILDTSGRLLLQLRDNVPNILYPGKIGLFGGHREAGESFLECIVREVHEELSYYIPAERFELIAHHEGPDIDIPGGILHAQLFLTRGVPVDDLKVTEGSLKILEPSEVDAIDKDLSPSARYAVRLFFGRELNGI